MYFARALSRVVSVAGASGLVFACSSSSSGAAACSVAFTGNTTESSTLGANCAKVTLDQDAGTGNYTLSLSGSLTQVAQIDVAIGLGSSPTATTVSSETATEWSVLAVAGNADCTFGAGTTEVPAGSFTLTLTSIDPNAGVAHGTLDVTMYVHAPPQTDCGVGDTEDVSFAF